MALNISSIKDGGKLCLALSGRLDTTTAPQLDKVVNDQAADAEALVFDLANLDYISSAGLRVLLSTHKMMAKHGGLTIKNVHDDVMEVFEITGFSDILCFE